MGGCLLEVLLQFPCQHTLSPRLVWSRVSPPSGCVARRWSPNCSRLAAALRGTVPSTVPACIPFLLSLSFFYLYIFIYLSSQRSSSQQKDSYRLSGCLLCIIRVSGTVSGRLDRAPSLLDIFPLALRR